MESLIGDYMSKGLTRKEAELRAPREFGGVELAKDECRDQTPLEWFDQTLRVRYAARSLPRTACDRP